jgi:hypothetical protein
MVGLRAGKWSEDSGRILYGIHMHVHIIGAHHSSAIPFYVQAYYGQIKGRQVVGGQLKNIM